MSIQAGTLLKTNKENVYAFAAKGSNGEYYDFMSKDEPIWILNDSNSRPDPNNKLHAYVGDALNPPQQSVMKLWAGIFSDVGTATGRSEVEGGILFYQVSGSLWVYNPYVNKDSFLKTALYWVKASEVMTDKDYKEKASKNAELEKKENESNLNNPESPQNQGEKKDGLTPPTSAAGSGAGTNSKTGLILGIIAGVVLIGVTIWAIVTRKKED
ncbi:hypothetical protein [Cellulophaga sp. BC115SP]|uniref:hypothetical protein n=1 Tax=Cellulophaga sp. BC115SP TaxID=2683263 RepID=UPI0014124C8B|nr:hypothetical protein [Cellulophaga sp. BC115SP]NBB31931.1 hypothetical protein [Cellulophaga sp. BC115SP]